MFVLNAAYAFTSELTLDQIYDALTAASPWKWCRRENYWYGDYLWASTDIERSALRVIAEDGQYIIDVEFHSDSPAAKAACDALHRQVREELLPALGATAIRPAPHHGR